MITPSSLTQYEDYYITDKYGRTINMTDLCPKSSFTVGSNPDKFLRTSTAMSQSAIQNFLVSKNSPLQYWIQVWAVNSSNQKYNTGKWVLPSDVIYQASVNSIINPKVILATIQKESSLITVDPGSYSSSAYIWAMGQGYTDNGIYYSQSGFENQITIGANTFSNLWYEGYVKGSSAFPYLMTGINFGNTANYNGQTFKNYVWVKNCGTYALYRYTPHTFNTRSSDYLSGDFDSGNHLFDTCMRVYWNNNWD
jgi:hypothetical protein